MLNRILLAALAMAMSALNTYAQNSTLPSEGIGLAVEVDPATFAFNGYGVHLRYQPKKMDHLLVGLGLYAMDMPDVLVDLNPKNQSQGWELRLNQGLGIFAEHHFTEVHRKWFAGGQIGLQEYQIALEEQQGKESFTNLLVMGYAGYTWKPFGINFYVKPWAGMGYTRKIAGDNRLANKTYDISPVTMFATLHLGYHF